MVRRVPLLLLALAVLVATAVTAMAQVRVYYTSPPVVTTVQAVPVVAAPAPSVVRTMPLPVSVAVPMTAVQSVQYETVAAYAAYEVPAVEVARPRRVFHPRGSPVGDTYLATDGTLVTVEDRVPFMRRGPVRRAVVAIPGE